VSLCAGIALNKGREFAVSREIVIEIEILLCHKGLEDNPKQARV